MFSIAVQKAAPRPGRNVGKVTFKWFGGRAVTLIFLLLTLIFSSCAGYSRVVWKNPHVIRTDNYKIIHERRLSKAEEQRLVKRIDRIYNEIVSYYQPRPANRHRIGFYVFRNNNSYQEFSQTRFQVKTAAHFQRKTGDIYIPGDAPDYVWRHELSHAILEAERPDGPYWFQEGLAFFIQNNPSRHPISCEVKRKASLPIALRNFLPEVRKLSKTKLKRHFNIKDSQSLLLHDPALSGYFIFYLWSENQLSELIQVNRTRHDLEPEEFLGGRNREEWDGILNNFSQWLKTAEPLQELSGC